MIINKKSASILSVILSVIMSISCFAFTASATDISIAVKPTQTTFYQGIDWVFNSDGSITTIGNLNISGTVINYGSKQIPYSTGKFGANMYVKTPSGGWKAGDNEVKIYCNDFSSTSEYVTITLNLATITGISVARLPNKTILVAGTDWKLSVINDVEMTTFDLTGAELNVTYNDSSVKKVSYPQNTRIGWAVPKDADKVSPGPFTMYLTFCGKSAPINVTFVTDTIHALGDVNIDNKITSYDALLILQHVTGITTLSTEKAALADVNADKKVNSGDALEILQYIVGNKLSFS
jgi:hypothetical protein